MMKYRNILKEFLLITGGTVIAAAAIYFFMLPSHIAVGSGSALAMILSNYIPLPVSALSLIINVILLILGFVLIVPEFGAKTIYTAILLPMILGVFEIFFPDFQSLTEEPFLDVICYILVVGIGMAILFSCNASSGGMDIVAKILNKYLKIDLGQAVSASGMTVALLSALCYDKKTVVLSVLGTYFGGMVVDHFIFGLNLKRRVCIISPKVNEIVDYILYDLHSGATLNDIIGAYDKKQKREIITIVDKHEYKQLMDYLNKVDPKAFITVYAVSEIKYQPKVKQ